jgi:hypothetical protein
MLWKRYGPINLWETQIGREGEVVTTTRANPSGNHRTLVVITSPSRPI